jgi:hypothetical protein
MCVYHSSDERFACNTQEGAGADATVGESCNSGRPSAKLFEDKWVRNEAEIENCVQQGDVQIPEDAVKC